MENKETYQFKTEVQQLLNLIINSLYSNKEIFLRELISNASDAIDRLRFKAQTNPDLLKDDPDFRIKIIPNKDNNTLEISDNGIGMTKEELIENIGTIAHSGTKDFLKKIEESKEPISAELIGQFGVGFYSAFMVADEITVITKSAESDKAYKWISKGDGSYSIEESEKDHRGTDVIIQLKNKEEIDQNFTEEWTIRSIIKKHSDFINYPIKMDVERIVPEEDDKADSDKEQKTEILGSDGKPISKTPEILDQDGKPVEKEPEKKIEEETLNSMKAIWVKSKNDVTTEEYNEFYKHISHDFSEPLEKIHVKMEGALEYYALLYIPSKSPFDLFNKERKHGIDLYCKRVFIMNNCTDLMPEYLRFIKGVVDSSDLDLNVSREILQQNAIVKKIRKNNVKKVLDLFASMPSETYEKFYKEFGHVLKEGIHTDWENKDKIADLLRYPTSKSEGKLVSLKDYVDHMKSDQKEIYYLTGEKLSSLLNNPALEKLKEKDYEVILMTDYVDEWVVQSLTEYKEKKLRSAEKGDLDLDKIDDTKKNEYKGMFEHIKTKLDEKVKEVKPSSRLKDSVACFSSDEYDMSSYMEKIMKATQQDLPARKRILEINMDHPLASKLKAIYETNKEDEKLTEYYSLLYDIAVIGEGGRVENPASFIKNIGDMAANAL